jgi:hypothetical protein
MGTATAFEAGGKTFRMEEPTGRGLPFVMQLQEHRPNQAQRCGSMAEVATTSTRPLISRMSRSP